MQVCDIYTRVSGDPQEDNTSLDEQARQCRELCKRNGFEVGIVHREVHTGYEYRERQVLTVLRERIRGGKIQGVAVYDLGRMSRDYVHYAILMEEREHHNVKIYAVKDDINSDGSKMDKFVQMVFAFVADMERAKIIDRTIDGRIARAKQGKIAGGNKLRYGWKWHDETVKDYVVLDEAAAAIIRWCAEQYVEGTSAMAIAQYLDEQHIPTPGGEAVWTPRGLRRLLRDVRNTGTGAQMFINPKKHAKRNLEPVDLPDGTYPAIFDVATYEHIMERARTNKSEASRNGADPSQFLLRSGFVRCGSCGRLMIGCCIHDSRRPTAERYLYVCIKTQFCPGHTVPSKRLDDEVWTELVQLADHITLIEQAVALATNRDNSQANLKAVERTLAEWNDKALVFNEDLKDTRLRGATRATIRKSLDDALEMVERLEGERQKILAGAFDRQREKEAYAEILAWCKTVKIAREELTYQQKRDFLRLLGVVVIVNRVKRTRNSPLSYGIRLALPALQQLVGTNQHEIVGASSPKTADNRWFIGIEKGRWIINPALLRTARSA